MMKKSLFVFIVIALSLHVYAAPFEEGRHYKKLTTPVATEDKNRIEVRELFWYYCPHCYNIEPYVDNYIASKGEDVYFVREPAVFNKRWERGAVFYFVLEELAQVEALHAKLFEAIHVHDIMFSNKEDFINWLSDNGVKREDALDTWDSFALSVKLNKAKKRIKKYQVNVVPSFVINGKYTTSAREAGSVQNIFKVIRYLSALEAKNNL